MQNRRSSVCDLRHPGNRPEPHIIFVYGTLRQGFENHEAFLKRSHYMGMAKTSDKYALYADEFPYVWKYQALSQIVGELYAVDESTLEAIDGLEGHPDHYVRERITVIADQGKVFKAWIYFHPAPAGQLIASGDYKDHLTVHRAG
jgi:gamma-glutamylaminecyclotransferase